jgi:hypothetical protein
MTDAFGVAQFNDNNNQTTQQYDKKKDDSWNQGNDCLAGGSRTDGRRFSGPSDNNADIRRLAGPRAN